MKTPEQLAALAKPSVHLNGTNGNNLFEEYRAAMDAVNNAIVELSKVTVHGRDYYAQPGDVLHQALQEHRARFSKLEEVYDELLHIAQYLADYADGGQYGRVRPLDRSEDDQARDAVYKKGETK